MIVAPNKVFAQLRRQVAEEISQMARYVDEVVQLAPLDHDSGQLLDFVDAKRKRVARSVEELKLDLSLDARALIVLNGNFNHSFDIEGLLRSLKPNVARGTRIAVVLYNPYLEGIHQLAHEWGLRPGDAPSTFITSVDLSNVCRLAGFDIARERPTSFIPFGEATRGLNRLVRATPIVRRASLASVVVLRPIVPSENLPSLSVVIPARNERGNIEDALIRLRPLNERVPMEVVFVEGNSTDGTWDEIQRVVATYSEEYELKAFKQPGKGKNDAVRVGFTHASKDLLTILDADLTMPPELLHRFYDAYVAGRGDFINGSRLTYPMEGEAMRPLNRLGNVFFAKSLSFVLDTPLSDSLCGTKLLSRRDYERVIRWRQDFGDFDPFGDFELLFPASTLALGIVDVPVRYRARTYGETNIRRFRDGAKLLGMTQVGLRRVRMGK
ncbi:MAG: glycosyltransferase family 2 protein [Myxococcota bacterium]